MSWNNRLSNQVGNLPSLMRLSHIESLRSLSNLQLLIEEIVNKDRNLIGIAQHTTNKSQLITLREEGLFTLLVSRPFQLMNSKTTNRMWNTHKRKLKIDDRHIENLTNYNKCPSWSNQLSWITINSHFQTFSLINLKREMSSNTAIIEYHVDTRLKMREIESILSDPPKRWHPCPFHPNGHWPAKNIDYNVKEEGRESSNLPYS